MVTEANAVSTYAAHRTHLAYGLLPTDLQHNV